MSCLNFWWAFDFLPSLPCTHSCGQAIKYRVSSPTQFVLADLTPQRLLSLDVWLIVFDFTPGRELLRLLQTCRGLCLLVKAYWPLAFSLSHILCPFIGPGLVQSFRAMLKALGGVISGSAALQFLNRLVYETANMDIYVPSQNYAVMEWWLLDQGLTKLLHEEPNEETVDCSHPCELMCI